MQKQRTKGFKDPSYGSEAKCGKVSPCAKKCSPLEHFQFWLIAPSHTQKGICLPHKCSEMNTKKENNCWTGPAGEWLGRSPSASIYICLSLFTRSGCLLPKRYFPTTNWLLLIVGVTYQDKYEDCEGRKLSSSLSIFTVMNKLDKLERTSSNIYLQQGAPRVSLLVFLTGTLMVMICMSKGTLSLGGV